ncbi:mannose-ethanolamine phosphotransferase gpi13 [Gaertneriomyces sp. JEL0708]|nr:mannose-ethanolamine phosphotransferase gpi13 [Gaertneriomyces sp. JEL0708]
MLRRKLAARSAAQAASAGSSTKTSVRTTPQTPPASTPAQQQQLVTVDLTGVQVKASSFWKLLATISCIVGVTVVGLYIFTSGFLLTRIELDNRSQCAPGTWASNHEVADTGCWHPAPFKRAVLVVLDALRFDFTVYDETLAKTARSSGDNSSIPYYLNKLPVFNDLSHNEPDNCLHFRVRADPPTTTLQRLKALTTGTLPTFVDAGSNFFGQIVGEDNLIEQCLRQKKRVVFMGDDTWETMYPNLMTESYPYPSLEVWDLHTVDNGILNHLVPALRRPGEWDLLIAHFLGVDHAGHRYGPSHPAMAEKLTQMDGILRDVFASVDDETAVFVIGDHGMDQKGDHGGDSENEVNAGLFIYTKKGFGDRGRSGGGVAEQRLESFLGDLSVLDFEDTSKWTPVQGYRTISQIDFVPTMAMMLGIPIPHGNLGTVIPECFMRGEAGKDQESTHTPEKNLLDVTRLNARQIRDYLSSYTQHRMGAGFDIDELLEMYESAEMGYSQLDGQGSVDAVKDVFLKYVRFTRGALTAARRIWSRFDVGLIMMGSVVLVLSWVCVVAYSIASVSPPPWVPLMGGLVGLGMSAGGVVTRMFEVYSEEQEIGTQRQVKEHLFGFTVGSMAVYLLSTGFCSVFNRSRLLHKTSRLVNVPLVAVIPLLLVVLHTVLPASDSFTIYEDNITAYLLQTLGCVSLILAFTVARDDSNNTREKLIKYALLFILLTRMTSYSTICREEQHPYCIPTFNDTPTSSVAPLWGIVCFFALIPVVVAMMNGLLKSSDNDQGTARVLGRAILPGAFVVVGVYWLMDTLENRRMVERVWGLGVAVESLKYWWARVGFLTAAATSLFVWSGDPTCLGVDVVDHPSVKGGRTVCLLGVPNAVGGAYFLVWGVAVIGMTMVQKPVGGVMVLCAAVQGMIVLEMLHLWRDRVVKGWSVIDDHPVTPPPQTTTTNDVNTTHTTTTTTTEEDVQATLHQEKYNTTITLYALVALYLLSHHHFFTTGHQTTLSTIQWDIGYIGIRQLNYTLSPLLITLNTFSSHVLFTALVPLIYLWKRPLINTTHTTYVPGLTRVVMAYLAMQIGTTVAATVGVGGFRRHLMVWRVFAPKYLFAVAGFVVVAVVVVVAVAAVWMGMMGYLRFLKRMKMIGIL